MGGGRGRGGSRGEEGGREGGREQVSERSAREGGREEGGREGETARAGEGGVLHISYRLLPMCRRASCLVNVRTGFNSDGPKVLSCGRGR